MSNGCICFQAIYGTGFAVVQSVDVVFFDWINREIVVQVPSLFTSFQHKSNVCFPHLSCCESKRVTDSKVGQS